MIMKRRAVLWVLGFSVLVVAVRVFVAVLTVYVDPFFHYHEPRTDEFYYSLDNQRSQSDGIVKRFDYQGIITGTSMTENFRTTEAYGLFDCRFVKVPLSGATFKEISDLLETALNANPDLRIIIRGLDINRLGNDPDQMRTDLGEYPTYLYDNDLFNDIHYVFSREVVFSRVYTMVRDRSDPYICPGITHFNEYSNWMDDEAWTFGRKTLYPDGVTVEEPRHHPERADIDMGSVRENIRQNVAALAEAWPDVTFYCFFTPYSAKWWQTELEAMRLDQNIEAERIAIEELLKYDNIRLFSFNNLTNITTDLNNYKDATHYGDWINSLILRYMYDGRCLLTPENYEAQLEQERQFYSTFDYTLMNDQEDYDDDSCAAQLLHDEIYSFPGE